jgi:hypothetical protein
VLPQIAQIGVGVLLCLGILAAFPERTCTAVGVPNAQVTKILEVPGFPPFEDEARGGAFYLTDSSSWTKNSFP